MAQQVRTIFLVVGAAHGGTSIAVMLLGQHPNVFATGELTRFARAFELAELIRKEPDLRLVVVSIVRPADSVASSQLRVALERNRINDNAWSRLKTVAKAVVSRQKILRQIQAEKLNCEVATVNYATLCDRPLDVLRPIWEKAEIESMSSAQWLGGGARPVHKPKHMIRGNRKLRSREKIELRRDLSASTLSRLEKWMVILIDNLPFERLVSAIVRVHRGLRRRLVALR